MIFIKLNAFYIFTRFISIVSKPIKVVVVVVAIVVKIKTKQLKYGQMLPGHRIIKLSEQLFRQCHV